MKKLLTITLASILIVGLLSTLNDAKAQTTDMSTGSVQEGDIKIGAGLVFGSGIGAGTLDNDIGIRVDGYYAITPKFRAGADFTFYFPKSEGDFDLTVWELNLNGNYIFLDEDGLIVYGIGGVNITGFSQDFPTGTGVASTNSSETGLNLGAGLEYALDFADFFGEAKLGGLGGNANQFVLGAGLRFPI